MPQIEQAGPQFGTLVPVPGGTPTVGQVPSVATILAGAAATWAWASATGGVPYGAQVVSVKDPTYGAVGDGVTDDWAACTAALAASKYVEFPPGQYNMAGKTLIIPDAAYPFGPGKGQDTGTGVSSLGATIMTTVNMTGVRYLTGDTTYTATVATLPGAAMTPGQWVGYTVLSGGSTGIVTANTATTITVTGGWKGGTPAAGSNVFVGNDLVQLGTNVAGSYAGLRDINVDGGTHLPNTDCAAFRILGADCTVLNLNAKSNSAGPAFWAYADRCNIVNCTGRGQNAAGNDSLYMTSTDPIMVGGRYTGGRAFLGGTGLIAANVHFTGGNPNVEINGSSNFLVNCYYDSCAGTAVIKHSGGSRVHIMGGLLWQATPGVTAPAILQSANNSVGMHISDLSVALSSGVNQFTYLFSGPAGNVARIFNVRCPGGTALQLWDNAPSAWRNLFYGQSRTVADAVTNGTTTVTSATAAFSATTDVGASVSGTNIPAGATVVSVTNATTAVISATASGSGSGGALTVSRPGVWLYDNGPDSTAKMVGLQAVNMGGSQLSSTALTPAAGSLYLMKLVTPIDTLSKLWWVVGNTAFSAASGLFIGIALYESNGTTLTLRGSKDVTATTASGLHSAVLAAAAQCLLPGTEVYVAFAANGTTLAGNLRGQGTTAALTNTLNQGTNIQYAVATGVTITALADFPTSILLSNVANPAINGPIFAGVS